MLKRLDAAVASFAILMICAYRTMVGRWLPLACRFEPSCSRYAEQAFRRYGVVGGTLRTSRRLLRCHPFHPGGLDPLD